MKILFALILPLMIVGCSVVTGEKVDTTKAVEAVSGSHEGAPLVMNGELLDQALAGKVVVLPTWENKNYRILAYYPDGQKKYDVVTSKSEVVDSILGGARGIDSDKMAQDRWYIQHMDERIDKLIGLLAGKGYTPSDPATPPPVRP